MHFVTFEQMLICTIVTPFIILLISLIVVVIIVKGLHPTEIEQDLTALGC